LFVSYSIFLSKFFQLTLSELLLVKR